MAAMEMVVTMCIFSLPVVMCVTRHDRVQWERILVEVRGLPIRGGVNRLRLGFMLMC